MASDQDESVPAPKTGDVALEIANMTADVLQAGQSVTHHANQETLPEDSVREHV